MLKFFLLFNFELPVPNADFLLSTTDLQLQIVNSKLQITNRKSQIKIENCKLSIANCQLQLFNCQLQLFNCKLQIANRQNVNKLVGLDKNHCFVDYHGDQTTEGLHLILNGPFTIAIVTMEIKPNQMLDWFCLIDD